MIDLSVLVPSVTSRWDTFARSIQEQLYGQLAALPPADQSRVEILVLTDNKTINLGRKRNQMLAMSQGRYVAFVDDDDRLEPSYLTDLLAATQSGADALCFVVSVSLDGGAPLPCHYSKNFPRDRNTPTAYLRLPNHLMAVKRELALKAGFPELGRGEDSEYAKRLRPFLETEKQIERVLYHYEFSSVTTETQRREEPEPPTIEVPKVVPSGEPVMDVVILSKASRAELHEMTQRAVTSCIENAGAPVNVWVMEQVPGVTYDGAHYTVYMFEPFAYNMFANQGAQLGLAPWIMVANNDLVFEPGWLPPLLAAGNPVVSPICPAEKRQRGVTVNLRGTQIGTHFSGWCFAITRELWERIGGFDEDFTFWCADDAVVQQVIAQGVEPMAVPASRVLHLGSATHKDEPDPDSRTWAQVYKFEQKYGVTKFAHNRNYARWKYANRVQQARARVQRAQQAQRARV